MIVKFNKILGLTVLTDQDVKFTIASEYLLTTTLPDTPTGTTFNVIFPYLAAQLLALFGQSLAEYEKVLFPS